MLLATGCEVSEQPRPLAGATPRAGDDRGGIARSATAPRRPRVENSATGRSGRLIARAVLDLKRLGLWRRLTRHLYRIYLSSREGAINIPDDRHLADALLTAQIDRRGSGALCDIRFYPAAIARDLERQRDYFEGGRLPSPPPSPRQFWVSVLGHELAHCLPHPDPLRQVGERTARRWERKVLDAARRAWPVEAKR